MDNQSVHADVTTEQTEQAQHSGPSTERAASEEKKAYGSAKTENLRDSGLWRVFLMVCIVAFALALFAIPLIILIPLLTFSLSPTSPTGPTGAQLTWLWITMIIIVVSLAALIIWGLYRTFMTQAGNYPT
jgi:uncharacterized BrkB/YihY/UPF0761 family membrane protein